MLVDALGNPFRLMLTPGQDHDLTGAEPLLETANPRALIGDKAYDADPLIHSLDRRAIIPVIPPKANRKVTRDCDFVLYCERNLVERFFNKIRTATAASPRATTSSLKFSRRCPVGGGYHPTQLKTVLSSSSNNIFLVRSSLHPFFPKINPHRLIPLLPEGASPKSLVHPIRRVKK